MPGADSIGVDRRLVARLIWWVVLLFLFAAGFTTLHRAYSRKFLGAKTRNAEWIWASHRMASRVPVAFFAVRDFDLPASRRFTHVKIYGEPQYTFYFNGREVASRRVGGEPRLDLYDVSALARDGRNRIVVALRSTVGVGGLIAGVDIEPEKENFVVTGKEWKIFRTWRDDLPLRDPAGVPSERPMILGGPPIGRWNYPGVIRRAADEPVQKIVPPAAVSPVTAIVPTIREVSGVYVAGTEELRATAFDFVGLGGRVRLTMERDSNVPRVVEVRLANTPEDLRQPELISRSFVFAPGERTVLDPEKEVFRYALVFSRQASATVAQ